MGEVYLKQAPGSDNAAGSRTTETVAGMLSELDSGGEAKSREFAQKLDAWQGDIVVPEDWFRDAEAMLPESTKDDLRYAHARVRDFAQRQRDSQQEFEIELLDGLMTGQRLIPVTTAGCYVPGGRYAHAASAIMSVCTAKTAGVENVIATSPAKGEERIHPAILYAMKLSGADRVLALGGVQGVAALAYGHFTGHPADIIVGPGNSFVAEAKRMLFGRVGIDVIAGPTESMVVADHTADPAIVAADLAGQAEHGPDSPVWLATTSRELGEKVIELMPGIIAALPGLSGDSATAAWRDFGEVILTDTREEACAVCDRYAPEHLQVQAEDLDWWLRSLKNYGSLFLGEETTVAFGDKCSGPNHILPTRGAGRYSGGLNAQKFVKVLTYQRMTRGASRGVAQVASRISRLEGMEGHAMTGDVRLAKYFPDEVFKLEPEAKAQ
ncbi:histidinol dehydrogenase [Pelagibius litoralis]|uniref:Histidinol dehydrogenase n=1 Tax=Pelagibius litoralis TaxID=374515 RepID=A0A967K8M4_9PROT|nr:histidinol dehydrogenase [Pelagibius litoralis]NIA69342.1 histidinol dehydrogenase [Pelagibius litoralis]